MHIIGEKRNSLTHCPINDKSTICQVYIFKIWYELELKKYKKMELYV